MYITYRTFFYLINAQHLLIKKNYFEEKYFKFMMANSPLHLKFLYFSTRCPRIQKSIFFFLYENHDKIDTFCHDENSNFIKKTYELW